MMDDLFAHGLRIGDGGTEESVPLQSSVKASPVIVPITSVRKTPRDQRVVLLVHGIAYFSIGTRAHSAQGSVRRSAVLVFVRVTCQSVHNH